MFYSWNFLKYQMTSTAVYDETECIASMFCIPHTSQYWPKTNSIQFSPSDRHKDTLGENKHISWPVKGLFANLTTGVHRTMEDCNYWQVGILIYTCYYVCFYNWWWSSPMLQQSPLPANAYSNTSDAPSRTCLFSHKKLPPGDSKNTDKMWLSVTQSSRAVDGIHLKRDT